MKQFMKKVAVLLALVLTVTSIPVSAKAATTPAFRSKKTNVYENSSVNGVYKYTVSGVQKGYKIKWGITGTGKKYVTLKHKTTKATKTTSSNQITINTNGDTAAKNVKFNVIAKVYDKSGNLIATVKDKPTIKICAETLTMSTAKVGSSLEGLAIGQAYDFDAAVTPLNATSNVYWTVTATDGTDHSTEITSDGVWTPTAAGEYTIKAEARNSATSKVLCAGSVKVSVGAYIKAIAQTGANELKVVFSTDVTDKLTDENVTIEAKAGTSTVVPKEFKYDTVGKTVTITTHTNFKNNTEYVFSYGNASKTFTASVGEPVTAKILTETVPADTFVTLEYALYDSKGIDVKNACSGEITLDGEITNGTLTDGILYMTTPGKKANITLTYTKTDGSTLTASKTITCVEATVEEAAKTQFTITDSSTTPDFDDSDFESVNYIALEDKGYVHFRALDSEGDEITYDAVKFSSSNDNVLIVTEDGELTPIKTGSVKIFVVATKGETELNYTFSVSVKAAKELSSVTLSTTSVTMSNAYEEGYQKTIDVTAYDQYKNEYDLSAATVEIEEVSSNNSYADIEFDSDKDQIIIKNTLTSGTHTYKVTVTIDDKEVSANFKLIVKQIPYSSSTINYSIEVSDNSIDTVVNKKTTGDKTAVIRLAQYRGGVFEKYVEFESATIKKGGKYFTTDLTVEGSSDEVNASDGGTSLTVTAMKLATECKKADTGSYSVTIKYYNDSTNTYKTTSATIKVTDTQVAPAFSVDKLVSGTKVTNALDLVRECISVKSGTIYDCTAVGEDETGSKISISSGDQLHIKTISVKEEVRTGSSDYPVVYVYHTITVGKTLTNK